MKRYLAYGSNLSVDQMRVRCPDAKVVGMTALYDWKLVFKRHADIVPCEGKVVPMLVWEISEKDEAALDVYEGYPRYYIKRDLKVTMTDLEGRNPEEITGMVYVMAGERPLREPAKTYYLILKAGYEHFGFNEHLLDLALQEAQDEGLSG